jgi:hypothetical protein
MQMVVDTCWMVTRAAEAVGRPPGGEGGVQEVGMSGLLEEMDGAQRVVVLGGREEGAWRALYGGDGERERAHRAKMVVMGEETTTACGRRVARSELLRANGESARAGEEEDASRWWWDGRLQAVLHVCKKEVRALARIAIAAEARLPGRQATAAVSIRADVLRGMKRGAAGRTGEGRARTVAQRTGSADAEGGARTRGEKRRREYQPAPPDQSDGCDTANNGDRRADGVARQRTEVETYDETKRRGTRKRKATYLVIDGQRAGARRDSIAAGAATLDRTVGQRYEWRDSGLADTKRRRSGPPGGARNGA